MKRKKMTNGNVEKTNPVWQQIIAFGIAAVEQDKQPVRQNSTLVFQVMP